MPSTPEKPECAGYLRLREEFPGKDESLLRAACHGDAGWEIEGKNYCLMHAPTRNKAEEFKKALQDKLAAKDYNFRGVWFPGDAGFREYNFESEVNFNLAVFGGSADFREARFSGGYANFGGVQFSGGSANFSEAQFSGGYASFFRVQFSGGEANFYKAQFSGGGGADFSKVQFSGGEANFYKAQFRENADFSKAQFSGNANFNGAQFSGSYTNFSEIQFSGGSANFSGVQFSGEDSYFIATQFSKTVYFKGAVFAKNLVFTDAVFEKQIFFDKAEFRTEACADFGLARFMDFTRFMDLKIENGAELYFGEATFEKPERVHFHSIPNLQPRWFINVDTRKFNFESVDFPLLMRKALAESLKLLKLLKRRTIILKFLKRGTVAKFFKWKSAAEKELKETRDLLKRLARTANDDEPPHKLLITAYRRLAANAEENNRYEEGMGFRYLAMETHRRAAWWRRWPLLTLHWWYWVSSGYGERAWRAAAMLLLVWLVPFLFYLSPAAVFTRVETKRDEEVRGAAEYHVSTEVPGMTVSEAVLYSLNTMAFQKPEPKASKTSTLTQWVVFAQTILGPLQAALLALAIRRKFMR